MDSDGRSVVVDSLSRKMVAGPGSRAQGGVWRQLLSAAVNPGQNRRTSPLGPGPGWPERLRENINFVTAVLHKIVSQS